MSETERLRALLDGRGVKWWPMRNGGYYEDRDTEFVIGGKKHTAHEWGDGLAVYNLTAQQAVDATLGREVTPMLVSDDLGHVFITLGGIKTWDVTEDVAALGRGECDIVYDGDLRWKCESCGEHWQQESDERNFCPNCGKAVKR